MRTENTQMPGRGSLFGKTHTWALLVCALTVLLSLPPEAGAGGRGVRPKGSPDAVDGSGTAGLSPHSTARGTDGGSYVTKPYTRDSRVDTGTLLGSHRSDSASLTRSTPAMKGPIKLGADDMSYVRRRHVQGGSESEGKSVFYANEDVAALIRKAEPHAPFKSNVRKGYYERVVHAGRPIGLDQAGKTTSIYTVVTRADNSLFNAYPGVHGPRQGSLSETFVNRVGPPRATPARP